MRILRTLLFISISLSAGYNLSAQSSDISEELEASKASLKVYQHLDELVKNARLKNEIEAYRFRALFSEDAKIVNEILASNSPNKSIGLDDYFNNMVSYDMGGTMITLSLRPYELQVIASTEELIKYKLQAIKVVGHLSTENIFYRDTFDLSYFINYQKADEKVKITGIQQNVKNGLFLRLSLSEKLKNDKSFSGKVLVNGELKSLDGEPYLMLKGFKEPTNLSIEAPNDEYLGNMNLVINPEDIGPNARLGEKLLEINFRPKRLFLTAAYRMGSFSENTVLNTSSNSFNVSGNTDVGDAELGIGYRFSNLNDRFFLSAIARFGMRSYESNYLMGEYVSNYESIDKDDDQYLRYTNLESTIETSSSSSIYAGLGLNARIKLHKYVGLNLGASYQMGLVNSGTYTLNSSASYYGYYSNYDLTIYDQSEYGFYSDQELEGTDDLAFKSTPAFILAQFGLDVRLTKKLYLTLDGVYNTQTSIYSKVDTESISTESGEVNSINGQLDDRDWSFIMYQFGLKFYL